MLNRETLFVVSVVATLFCAPAWAMRILPPSCGQLLEDPELRVREHPFSDQVKTGVYFGSAEYGSVVSGEWFRWVNVANHKVLQSFHLDRPIDLAELVEYEYSEDFGLESETLAVISSKNELALVDIQNTRAQILSRYVFLSEIAKIKVEKAQYVERGRRFNWMQEGIKITAVLKNRETRELLLTKKHRPTLKLFP